MAKDQKFFLLTFNEDWADEHDVPALAVMKEDEYKKWASKKLSFSAYLGNGGDDFCEDEQGKTGATLVREGTVSKYTVDENFVKIFNKADLADLSLSNIFDPDDYEEDEDDEDEDDEDFDYEDDED